MTPTLWGLCSASHVSYKDKLIKLTPTPAAWLLLINLLTGSERNNPSTGNFTEHVELEVTGRGG